jgi:hypothetical protein
MLDCAIFAEELAMLRRRLLIPAVAAGLAFGMAGCKHKCCRSDGPAPGPFLPPGPGSTIPPPGVPIIPPGSAGSLPPPDLQPSTSGRPAPEILLPDSIAPGGTSSQSKSSSGILGGPVNGPVAKPATLEPPIAGKPAAPAKNAGLPGFTPIRDGLAAGRKPTLDGFDSLKKDGYKTVVYLYAPGADVAAVRDLADNRGLSLVAIETTPDKLPEAFAQLNQATGEKAAQPAYVFDDDGTRAGAVWYLHFKTVELESADVSRIRAHALGLMDDSEFWPAIKNFLNK